MARKPRSEAPARSAAPVAQAGPLRDAAALGALIRRRRKESQATLLEAAGLSGVGIRFLHELEHGKATASLGKVLQVLDRMGLEVWVVPRGKKP